MQRSGNAAWLWLSKCDIDWAPSEDADAEADAPKTLVTMYGWISAPPVGKGLYRELPI
jgi:hypothetical protein